MGVDLSVIFVYFLAGLFKYIVVIFMVMAFLTIFTQFFTYDRRF